MRLAYFPEPLRIQEKNRITATSTVHPTHSLSSRRSIPLPSYQRCCNSNLTFTVYTCVINTTTLRPVTIHQPVLFTSTVATTYTDTRMAGGNYRAELSYLDSINMRGSDYYWSKNVGTHSAGRSKTQGKGRHSWATHHEARVTQRPGIIKAWHGEHTR